jgi:hypothetical protein
MTKIAHASFEGASGTNYFFETFSLDHEFENVRGVFIFSKRTYIKRRGTHKLLYIGQTEELAKSVRALEKWPCLKAHGANCICVLQESDKAARLNIESDLIKADNPPCNKEQ